MGCNLCRASPLVVDSTDDDAADNSSNHHPSSHSILTTTVATDATSLTPRQSAKKLLNRCERQGCCTVPTDYPSLRDAVSVARSSNGKISEIRVETGEHSTRYRKEKKDVPTKRTKMKSGSNIKVAKDDHHPPSNHDDDDEAVKLDVADLTIRGLGPSTLLVGGLAVEANNVKLVNLIIVENGIMISARSSLSVVDCEIKNCNGVGILTRGGSLEACSCHIHNNQGAGVAARGGLFVERALDVSHQAMKNVFKMQSKRISKLYKENPQHEEGSQTQIKTGKSGPYSPHVLRASPSIVDIRACNIHNNVGEGLLVGGSGSTGTVKNTLITHNESNGIFATKGGVVDICGASTRIVGNEQHGVLVTRHGSLVRLHESAALGCAEEEIVIASEGGAVTWLKGVEEENEEKKERRENKKEENEKEKEEEEEKAKKKEEEKEDELHDAAKDIFAAAHRIYVPTDCPTLSTACEQVSTRVDLCHIVLEKGSHVLSEPLRVQQSVMISGVGDTSETIVEGNIIVEQKKELSSESKNQSSSPSSSSSIRVALQCFTLISEDDVGLTVVDDNVTSNLIQMEVKGCARHGVWIKNGAQATMQECVIHHNGRHGLQVQGEGSVAEVKSIRSEYNKRAGVFACQGGVIHVRGSKSSVMKNGAGLICWHPNTCIHVHAVNVSHDNVKDDLGETKGGTILIHVEDSKGKGKIQSHTEDETADKMDCVLTTFNTALGDEAIAKTIQATNLE